MIGNQTRAMFAISLHLCALFNTLVNSAIPYIQEEVPELLIVMKCLCKASVISWALLED